MSDLVDRWNLFIAIVSLRFNISRENNDFGFNIFKKINFSKIFQFKCIREQI